MPPIRKYEKETILSIAYKIVEKEGIGSINARRIARELGSSVQPIFHNFTSMEELNKALYERIYQKYKECMLEGEGMGLAYIRFARDYPEFFKIIFMQQTPYSVETFIITDSLGDHVIKAGQKLTGLSYEEQKKFHSKVWIFTHGMACLVATKTVQIEENELSELLETTVRELLKGYNCVKELL